MATHITLLPLGPRIASMNFEELNYSLLFFKPIWSLVSHVYAISFMQISENYNFPHMKY